MAAPPPTYDELHPQESTEIALRVRVAELEAEVAQMRQVSAASAAPTPQSEEKPAPPQIRRVSWRLAPNVHTLLTPEILSENMADKDNAVALLVRLRRTNLKDITSSHIRHVANAFSLYHPEYIPYFLSYMYGRTYRPGHDFTRMTAHTRRLTIFLAIVDEAYPKDDQFSCFWRDFPFFRNPTLLQLKPGVIKFLLSVRNALSGNGVPVDRLPVETLVLLYQAGAPSSEVADLLSTTDPAIVAEALETIEFTDWGLGKFEKWSRRKILKAMKNRVPAAE